MTQRTPLTKLEVHPYDKLTDAIVKGIMVLQAQDIPFEEALRVAVKMHVALFIDAFSNTLTQRLTQGADDANK